MNLEVATNEQVIEWFDARPAYKEMLIEDMRKTLELRLLKGFYDVFGYTGFLIHSDLGVIPTYVFDNLVDPNFEVSADPDEFKRCIWQLLWFCLIQKTNFGKQTSEVVALNDFEKYKSEFEIELGDRLSEIADYLYGWNSKEFSNGKVFVSLSEINGMDLEKLKASEIVRESSSPSGLGLYEYSAGAVQDGSGKVFVRINADGDFLMEVASNEEAESILHEIWG